MIRPGTWCQSLRQRVPFSSLRFTTACRCVAARIGATGPIEARRIIVEFGPELAAFRVCGDVARHALKQVYIPYRDASSQQADFGEGRVQILSHALLAVRGPVATGKVRILAVTSSAREPGLPNVPTVAEAGFPEMEIDGLTGLLAGAICQRRSATGFPPTCRRWPAIPMFVPASRRAGNTSLAVRPMNFPRPSNGNERAFTRSATSSI